MLAEQRVTNGEARAGSIFDDLERYGDQLALIDQDQYFTYKDLISQADVLGAMVTPRTLALVVCSNTFESVAAYVGLSRAGVVPMLMPSTMTASQLLRIVDTFQPAYVATSAKMSDELSSVIMLNQLGDMSLYRNTNAAKVDIHNDLALMLSTSGSTGSHKFVRLSFANLWSNTDAISDFLGVQPDDRAITTMPMSYTFGLSILNTHLTTGASVIMTEEPMIGKSFWQQVQNHRATTFGGVPFIYEMLRKLRFGAMDLPSLRYITQAGGRLAPEIATEFAEQCGEKGIHFVTMYGQTEATARMSYVPAKHAIDKAGSIGIPIAGGTFWIKDDDGNKVASSAIPGELMYEGPNVSLGYAETTNDLMRGDDNKGVLATGDIACFDDDGYFQIVGRKKRFLKIYGYRVNLDEIEEQLQSAGFECACVGEDDALAIFVVNDDSDRVKQHVTQSTTVNARAIQVHKVDTIPRNPSGKVLYPELQRMLG